MTAERLKELLAILHWSENTFGKILNINEKTARRMCNGQHPIPDGVGAWLETLAAVHLAHPLPDGWASKS